MLPRLPLRCHLPSPGSLTSAFLVLLLSTKPNADKTWSWQRSLPWDSHLQEALVRRHHRPWRPRTSSERPRMCQARNEWSWRGRSPETCSCSRRTRSTASPGAISRTLNKVEVEGARGECTGLRRRGGGLPVLLFALAAVLAAAPTAHSEAVGKVDAVPPWRQPRGKWMVSSVNSHTNATIIGWHLWEIDLRFAPGLPPGWTSCPLRPQTGTR